MISLEKISAVVVTRGGYDLGPVLESLAGFGEVIVWDNSREENARVFGRYRGIERAKNDVVYVQDDDCLVNAAAIAAEYQPGKLVCNLKPEHRKVYSGWGGIALVGWGAVFDRPLVDFSRYLTKYPHDELFERECDRVFTFLNRDRQVWLEYPAQDLPRASETGCMWMEGRHGLDLAVIRQRLGSL